MEVVLIAEQVVLFAGIADIDQMIGHVMTVHSIVCEVFSGTDVHAAVDLSRVCTDDLRVQAVGEQSGEMRFSRCRRAEDGDEFQSLIHLMKDKDK